MRCHARAKYSANVGVGLGQVSSAPNQPLKRTVERPHGVCARCTTWRHCAAAAVLPGRIASGSRRWTGAVALRDRASSMLSGSSAGRTQCYLRCFGKNKRGQTP